MHITAVMFLFLGRGVPNDLAAAYLNRGPQVSEIEFPDANTAAELYSTLGGALTAEPMFSRNPFHCAQQQTACELAFSRKYPDLQIIVNNVVNGIPGIFQSCLEFLIAKTVEYSS